jgi:DNA-binding MarR family transcriptional regulator
MTSTVDELRSKIGHTEIKLWSGLTFNQLRMLKIVSTLTHDNPEGITLKVLASALQITPAAASEMVDALVHKNMLQRSHNQQDRRAIAIRLSTSCQERFLKYEQHFSYYTEEFCKTLPPEDVEKFDQLLAAFHAWVEKNVSTKQA